MIELTQVAVAAATFLSHCRACAHARISDDDNVLPRCGYRGAPTTQVDILLAVLGAASEHPSGRNYAARTACWKAAHGRACNPESSWVETWQRLDEPCQEFAPPCPACAGSGQDDLSPHHDPVGQEPFPPCPACAGTGIR